MKRCAVLLSALFAVCFMGRAQAPQQGGNVSGAEQEQVGSEFYINTAGALIPGSFVFKQLRLEAKGTLGGGFFYRFRHRIKPNSFDVTVDRLTPATDIMLLGYNFSDKLSISMGRHFVALGGFEYDVNPIYVYDMSIFNTNCPCYSTGVSLSYRPVPSQELVVSFTNAADEVSAYSFPHTVALNWNGSLFNGKLLTRWASAVTSYDGFADSFNLSLGQKLNLPTVQFSLDWMHESGNCDMYHVACKSKDVIDSFIGRLDYQFMPYFNLMLQGMHENSSSFPWCVSYQAALEYWASKASSSRFAQNHDIRFFLAYIGRSFSEGTTLPGASNYGRLELGCICRLKCF